MSAPRARKQTHDVTVDQPLELPDYFAPRFGLEVCALCCTVSRALHVVMFTRCRSSSSLSRAAMWNEMVPWMSLSFVSISVCFLFCCPSRLCAQTIKIASDESNLIVQANDIAVRNPSNLSIPRNCSHSSPKCSTVSQIFLRSSFKQMSRFLRCAVP